MALLEVNNVSKHFGGLKAVDQVSLSIEKGQIYGLIGPNGAGKSTLFNCVAGAYAPTSGTILYNGHDITDWKPWNICKLKIARTFQIVKPFQSKTVLYNATVGAFIRTSNRSEAEDRAMEVLRKFNLGDKANVLAKNLTIADRKRLEMARAMATDPEMLLMDECMAGLRPNEVDETLDVIREIRDNGVTIFIIEHIMRAIMSVSDRITVIQFGRKIMDGTPSEVANDERVIKAYLGESYGAGGDGNVAA
ncbi:MAG TPA: ABC transporter ATP-binding protein [Deltaproteobacteria bacterium]|nr:ABC transporter ATP-binding protein [Deltaproteobacteria bacterium]HOI08322.1 ABC transporter ATP-binding protein [Deltaproteobacteria bacterium]